jgi:hypothetical protein
MMNPRRWLVLLVVAALAEPAAAQTSLSPAQLARLKAATVFVKVRYGNEGATGSGFLVRADGATGYLVTNHHVIEADAAPGQDPATVKRAIEVVFDSGTPKERTAPALVAADDPDHDLAVLKVVGVRGLPEPISLAEPPKLLETMPVFVCGFPFGAKLGGGARNPAITIGPASVSSIRTDAAGRVALVQFNGAINPGNSGGPVVTADGKLVGVAVATIKASGLGFAIPQQDVASALRGQPGMPRIAKTADGLRLEVPVIDPLQQVKTVIAYVRPAGEAPPRGDPAKPEIMAKSKRLDLTIANQLATAPITMPGTMPKSLWVQVELQTPSIIIRTIPLEIRVGAMLAAAPGGGLLPSRPVPAAGGVLPAPTEVLPAPAEGTVLISKLNRDPGKYDGEAVQTEALTTCNLAERSDGYELDVTLENGKALSDLRIVLPRDLALQVADLGPQPGETFAVRLKGKVTKPAARGEKRHTLAVRELAFLLPDGVALTTLKPEADAPSGAPTLSTVNRFPEKFRGQTLVLPVVFKGVGSAGRGYPVHVANENDVAPLNLEFYASKDLYSKAEDQLPRGVMLAKLTCVVERVTARGHGILGVNKIEVLNPEAPTEAAKTLASDGKIIYPAEPPKPAPPKRPTAAVTKPSPGERPAAPEPEAKSAPSRLGLWAGVVGVGFFALAAVVLIAWVLLRGKGQSPARRRVRPVATEEPDDFPGFG